MDTRRILNLDEARAALAAALRRVDTLHAMKAAGPTSRGCCDDCHGEPFSLYDDPDEPEAGWQFCRPCLDRRIVKVNGRIMRATEACKAAGGHRCQRCGDFHAKGRRCECLTPQPPHTQEPTP